MGIAQLGVIISPSPLKVVVCSLLVTDINHMPSTNLNGQIRLIFVKRRRYMKRITNYEGNEYIQNTKEFKQGNKCQLF